MNAKILPKALFLFLFILSSCKEFIEPSIENKTLALKAPANHYETTTYTVNFWWEEVEDALNYRLQIVTPKFDSISNLIADTLVSGDKFSITLEPGEYQWQVRAENGSSQTAYSAPRSFTVQPGTLEEQTVVLVSPANSWLTNQGSVNLKWKSFFGAAKYRLQIDDGSFSEPFIYNEIIPTTEYTFSFPDDEAYYWRVQALNESESEQSKWSAAFSLSFDSTPPAKVILKSPADESMQTSPITLAWNPVASAEQYKLYVYESDGATLYEGFPKLVNSTSTSLNLIDIGNNVYWRVSAIDAAQNEGALSDARSFSLL